MDVRRRYTLILTPKILWIAAGEADDVLDPERFSITRIPGVLDALRCLRNEDFDVVVASLPLPDWSCAAGLLEEIQQAQPATPVVLHSPQASATEVVHLVRLGAFHVLQKGTQQGDAASLLFMAARSKWRQGTPSNEEQPNADPWRRLLIGESRPMRQVSEIIQLVARRRTTVLITGETGTGKEIVAQSIHASSDRARIPMVSVNCSALPDTLLEAELFGHVKGAFTGAMNQRVGRFEQANHSTIFLDEIGDLPLSLQAKLLRVLQEREFQRLGSSETVRVDLRVIAATHADLPEMIKQGKFREDLYYRLHVVQVAIPPLRERASDIRFLVVHFMEKICREEKISVKQISRETLDRLSAHDWPGNVRQLENAVEKAIVLSGERPALFPGDFPLPPRKHPATLSNTEAFIAVPDQGLDFEKTVGGIERNILEQALKKTRGNKKLAAQMLGLKRTTLAAKLKSLVVASAAG
jgi:DNA-binding NtrC family response regulator